MQLKTIGIIGGNGKMGQAFAKHFRKQGHTVLISGRTTELTHQDLARQVDIVIISVPIANTVEIIETIAPCLRPDTVLADFTSIKAVPLQAMLAAHAGPVIGLHPVFGPDNLVAGQTVVVCSGRGNEAEQAVRKLFADFRIIEMDADTHDKAMALVQGLQHFLETAFAATIAKMNIPLETLLAVSSPVYRIQMDLIGRIIGQDERLYDAIVHGTKPSGEAIKLFLETAQAIEQTGSPGFLQAFRTGRRFFGEFCGKAKEESDEIIAFLAAGEAEAIADQAGEERDHADIGVLGPAMTWSDLAAQKFFPRHSRRLFSNFPAIFSALHNNEITAALLPIENKISGTIRQVWEGIADNNCWISAVYDFPVAHVLAATGKREVRTIFSHEASLAQCRKFLARKYPKAKLVPVASNSEAILRARSAALSAAICSREAAEQADFVILETDIADRQGNATRFAIVNRKDGNSKMSGETVTTLTFGLKNVTGALFSVLKVFAEQGVNLTRLESVPSGENFAEYRFFIDFEGELTAEMAAALGEVTTDLRALGHYSVIKNSTRD